MKLEEKNEPYQAVTRGEFEGLALISRDTSDPGRFISAGGHALRRRNGRTLRGVRGLALRRTEGLPLVRDAGGLVSAPADDPLVLTSRLAAVREGLSGPEWGVADSLWWNVGDWKLEPM